MWWAESLLSWYWVATTKGVELAKKAAATGNQDSSANNEQIHKGAMYFTVNSSSSGITDKRFLNVDYRFVSDNGISLTNVESGGDNVERHNKIDELANKNVFPNIWEAAEGLAKAAYSTVLSDLGQMDSKPNILASTKTLESFTSDFSPSKIHNSNAVPGPAGNSYEKLKAETGPLDLKPSVISTTYLCQVPRLKSAGSLIFAILIADLVLLQVAWQLYKLLAEYLVGKAPAANFCSGCFSAIKMDQSLPTLTANEGPRESDYISLPESRTSDDFSRGLKYSLP